jgi:hypothetical protein
MYPARPERLPPLVEKRAAYGHWSTCALPKPDSFGGSVYDSNGSNRGGSTPSVDR